MGLDSSPLLATNLVIKLIFFVEKVTKLIAIYNIGSIYRSKK